MPRVVRPPLPSVPGSMRSWRPGVPGAARISPRRLTTAATWAALALVILAFAFLVVGPRTGAYRVSVVLSNSMKPAWEAGDVVISTPERPDQVRPGQVITFNPPIEGRPSVTHRVVAVDTSGPAPVVRTKGDANAAPDDWGAVRIGEGPVWRVRTDVPNLGWVLAFLRGPIVAIATTVVIPILLLLMLLRRIWRPAARRPGVSA